jgi:hypothetical protein
MGIKAPCGYGITQSNRSLELQTSKHWCKSILLWQHQNAWPIDKMTNHFTVDPSQNWLIDLQGALRGQNAKEKSHGGQYQPENRRIDGAETERCGEREIKGFKLRGDDINARQAD